jgi:general L-amino acid transport system permease protein
VTPVGRSLVRLLYNVRFLRLVAQAAFVAVVAVLLLYLWDNYQANTEGEARGFDFLDQPAGFGITDSDFRGGNSNLQAIVVGVKNTLLSAAVGIGLASVVGLVVGVLRLSRNWLVQKAATVYVELLRNVPVLLVIFFLVAALATLPRIDAAATPLDRFVISNRHLALPSLVARDGLGSFGLVLAAAVALALVVSVLRTRASARTGRPHHRVLYGGALVGGVAVVGWLVLRPLRFSVPHVDDAVVVGGFKIGIFYTALTLALGLYHASHVAEIVRGSILAVPRGQTEAATALGLSEFQRLRFVVLPQAFRVAIPPTLSQYLSLTKNTSLGVAVGYPEVFQLVNRIINTGRPALESIALLMAIYIVISLAVSSVINLFNRRLRLVER